MGYEQGKIQNSGEDRFDEFKRDRQEESLLDALQRIEGEEGCEHTPDTLNLIDTEDQGDRIIHHFECKCGKNIEEIFTLSETKVSKSQKIFHPERRKCSLARNLKPNEVQKKWIHGKP